MDGFRIGRAGVARGFEKAMASWAGGGRESHLWKREADLDGESGERDVIVNGGRVDSRAEGKEVDIGRAGLDIGSDGCSDRFSIAVMEAEADKVVNLKEGGMV